MVVGGIGRGAALKLEASGVEPPKEILTRECVGALLSHDANSPNRVKIARRRAMEFMIFPYLILSTFQAKKYSYQIETLQD
jgi:hypothetical protein